MMHIVVTGFRCHEQTVVDIRSPITAFCGLNGTGKTTLLQLAACAYKNSTASYKISDFFAVGVLDPTPFTETAGVVFDIWQDSRQLRTVTLSRRAQAKRWSDYRRRDIRHTLFVGCGMFLPRTERRDFVFRNSSRLTITTTAPVNEIIKQHCCTILGQPYEELHEHAVQHRRQTTTVLSALKGTQTYSEAHMGCGEGRAHTLIGLLESVPNKSLLLLEEPEISLHQSAQYRLGQYLVGLALRKGHQILLTTHSEHLLRALPQASRVYLYYDHASARIETLPGLAASQAVSLMAEGHDKALTVLVEDEAAKSVLTEIIGRKDRQFLQSICLAIAGFKDDNGQKIGGGKDAMKAAMKTLRQSGLKIAAVVDGEIPADTKNFVFKLPGACPPEHELFGNTHVQQYWREIYGLDVGAFRAGLGQVNHHTLFDHLAYKLSHDKAFLIGEAARVYTASLPENEVNALVEQLKDTAGRQ